GGEVTQDFSDNAEAPPRSIAGALVRVFGRSAAQDRQRLRGRLPQDRLLTRVCHIGHNARGCVMVRRGRRPNPLNSEFPFPELSVHGASPMRNSYNTRVKLSVSAPAILN